METWNVSEAFFYLTSPPKLYYPPSDKKKPSAFPNIPGGGTRMKAIVVGFGLLIGLGAILYFISYWLAY